MMDSQYSALEARSKEVDGTKAVASKKSRLIVAESKCVKLSSTRWDIEDEASVLCSIGIGIRYFNLTDRSFDNNRRARDLVSSIEHANHGSAAAVYDDEVLTLLHNTLDEQHNEVIAGRLNVNDANHCLEAQWKGSLYIIPRRSAFYAGDVNFVFKLVHGKQFISTVSVYNNLIVGACPLLFLFSINFNCFVYLAKIGLFMVYEVICDSNQAKKIS
ncbi:unnamed protein product [Soboliphyme baturini]|uniref:TNF_2 domain-containing protein n=1 Tax=Soboliphyme baturini TaxID=241478 RepID=A0A183IA13_9BILA|nr:unnamed protein product [Soboliphyme baturini]